MEPRIGTPIIPQVLWSTLAWRYRKLPELILGPASFPNTKHKTIKNNNNKKQKQQKHTQQHTKTQEKQKNN